MDLGRISGGQRSAVKKITMTGETHLIRSGALLCPNRTEGNGWSRGSFVCP